MKKILSLVMISLAVLSAVIPANAAETFSSLIFSSYRVNVISENSKSLTVSYDVTSAGSVMLDQLGVETMILQEQAPGSSTWSDVATYSYENNPSFMGYDTRSHWGETTCSVKSGYTYRISAVFMGSKGTTWDRKSYLSQSTIAR